MTRRNMWSSLGFVALSTMVGCAAPTDVPVADGEADLGGRPEIAKLAVGQDAVLDYGSTGREVAVSISLVAGTPVVIDVHRASARAEVRLLSPSGASLGALAPEAGTANRRVQLEPTVTGKHVLVVRSSVRESFQVEVSAHVPFAAPADPFATDACTGATRSTSSAWYLTTNDGLHERGRYRLFARTRAWTLTFREWTTPTNHPAIVDSHRELKTATASPWKAKDATGGLRVKSSFDSSWTGTAPIDAEGPLFARQTAFTNMRPRLWASFGPAEGIGASFADGMSSLAGRGTGYSATTVVAADGGSYPEGFPELPRRSAVVTNGCARADVYALDTSEAPSSVNGELKTYAAVETHVVVYGAFDPPLR
jgi:hypothetical protein